MPGCQDARLRAAPLRDKKVAHVSSVSGQRSVRSSRTKNLFGVYPVTAQFATRTRLVAPYAKSDLLLNRAPSSELHVVAAPFSNSL